MVFYLVNRLVLAVPVLLVASMSIFAMMYIIPGDPAMVIVGPDADPSQLAAVKKEMGLDRPVPVQYLIWLGRVLRGNLGKSFINGFPVAELIMRKVPATFLLTVGAFVVAIAISLPLGIYSALHPESRLGRLATGFNSLALSVPTFWLGILLVLLIGLHWRLLPASGYAPFFSQPMKSIKFLILPSITLGLSISAILARFLQASLMEVLHLDYVRTARAKGLREKVVISRHALKNALITVITVLGMQVGTFMGGAVVTESIFDWPGVGKLMLYAIQSRDYYVIQATFLFVVTTFIIINLVTDLTYAFLDPRIRYR
ncbi:MAG: ABC transporter permease [Candidatus Tectomicrobia bacterium]|nr:ABC transporter permease [Candidatus Tectomicrobia bacterium]